MEGFNEPNPIRKIGFDILVLVDMEAAQAEMTELWFGEDKVDGELSFTEYGPAMFDLIRPRPGALGVLRELNHEGCVLMFFTDITDSRIGDMAEKWLQKWSLIPDLALHQIKTEAGQTPVQLDCQAYVLPKGHEYTIPAGRPRVEEMTRGGQFDRKVLTKARKV